MQNINKHIMEEFKEKFEKNHKLNSLLFNSLATEKMNNDNEIEMINNDLIDPAMTNGLHMISSLYLYTNAPPHGYGTPAPKVAETVLRAYKYNCKKEKENFELFGLHPHYHGISKIEDFPFDEISGNFHPASVKSMAKRYLVDNLDAIKYCTKKTIDYMKRTNPDVLTKGRQTWDPESLKSVTSAKAYARFVEFLNRNGLQTPTTILEFFHSYMGLYNLEKLHVKKRQAKIKMRMKYDVKMKGFVKVEKKSIRFYKTTIIGASRVRKWIVDYTRSFCSYIKHGERGKKDRRAIASAGIVLRMLLHCVEYFHLELGRLVPGSTISLGGEEKKMKINQELFSNANKDMTRATYSVQATEDATKWNECLNALVFAIVHDVFFCEEARHDLGLSEQITDDEVLMKKICDLTFMFMTVKRINLGHGVIVQNETEYKRLDWTKLNDIVLNKKTKEWTDKLSEYMEDDGYIFSSPGFLMGMLNAASTTIGLLPVGYNQQVNCEVTTLRSSDDSMTVFVSPTAEKLACSIETNRKAQKLLGINPSTSKSFLFNRGYGEYTSWFQDGDFISQYGVETSSLKPGGSNAQDDFNTIASNTTTLLRTNTINQIGAIARIIVGVDNVRRLWKVPKAKKDRVGVSKDVLFLTDGGLCPWNLENIAFDEATIRYNNIKTDADRKYFMKVMDPQNPFSDTPEEKLIWSKQLFAMTVNTADTARNVFCYVRRSNKTINNETSRLETDLEKCYKEAYDIMMLADPSLYVKIPQSKTSISDYITASLQMKSSQLVLTDQEKKLYNDAMGKLAGLTDDIESDASDRSEIDDDL